MSKPRRLANSSKHSTTRLNNTFLRLALSQTDRLTNKYIMTWLHMPFPQNILNYLFFTPYIVYRARGEIRVGRAIARFLKWLGKDDRPRRKPLSPEAVAYIRSCGGAIWR